jgi:hypothetical protein
MADEEKNPQKDEGTEDGVDYIEASKKLRETTVSKEDGTQSSLSEYE